MTEVTWHVQKQKKYLDSQCNLEKEKQSWKGSAHKFNLSYKKNFLCASLGFPSSSVGEESTGNAGGPSLIALEKK